MEPSKISTATVLLEMQSVIWFVLHLIPSEAQRGGKSAFYLWWFFHLMNARHRTRIKSFQYSPSLPGYWQVEST